jgi:hypothetical protein
MSTDRKTIIRDSLADADLFARAILRLDLHDWQGEILYKASKPGRRRRIAVRAPNGLHSTPIARAMIRVNLIVAAT